MTDFADDDVMRKALREPFSKEQIGQVDKGYGPIDFVGHAAVVDRLNQAAPGWTYKITRFIETHGAMVDTGERKNGRPVTRFQLDPDGMPHLVAVYGWMEVGGVRRWETGQVDNVTTYGDELKKAISDFISRGAMRFGVALDLWSKQDLQASASPTAINREPSSSVVDKQVSSEPSKPADAEGAAQDAGLSAPVAAPTSSAAPEGAGTEAGGARQEPAGHGEGPAGSEGSPQPPSRHDQLWKQLVEFAGTKRKALNAVNTSMKASWTEGHISDIPEDDLEHTLRSLLQREGVA